MNCVQLINQELRLYDTHQSLHLAPVGRNDYSIIITLFESQEEIIYQFLNTPQTISTDNSKEEDCPWSLSLSTLNIDKYQKLMEIL